MVEASCLPEEVASLPLSEGINPVLPKETLMASLETATVQDNVDSPLDHFYHPFLPLDLWLNSYPKKSLKKGKEQIVIHEEIYYTLKELL